MSNADADLEEFVASLDLPAEQKRDRRVEQWLFIRGTLILLFVVAVVVVRSLLL